MKTLTALRKPDIFKLWLSQILSSMGDNFYDMAVVWIATREVGATAGLIVLFGSVSTLIFGLPGGVLVDRLDRRLTMAIVDAIRMVVLLLLVAVAAFGSIQLWHLALVTAINVGLNALFQPALIASIRIVSTDRAELQAVNALMDVTARLARALAPALAGLLLATTLPQYLFFMDAITFGISALAIFTMGRHYHWKATRKDNTTTDFLADVRDGWRVLQAHAVLRWIFPMKIVLNAFWGLVFIVGIPLLVDMSFNADPRAFGYIVAAYGVGNVISNLIIGNLTIKRRSFVMFLGIIIFGTGFIFIALAPSLPVALFGAFFASFGGPMDDIMMLLYIQEDIADEYTGKIYSLRVVLSEIGYSIGVASAAIIYTTLSLPVAIFIASMIVIGCGMLGLWKFGLAVHEPAFVQDQKN